MIRLVLDTNILVSAILTPHGIPAKIITLAREERVGLFFSHDTLKELGKVLHYPRLLAFMKKRGLALNTVETFIKSIVGMSVITPGSLHIEAVKDDPTDNIFLVCAVEGEADFIISGDHHLLDLKSFQGIKILSPADFLKLIEK